MPEVRIEDIVLLLDVSRSMLRKDFKPSRLVLELQTAKNFIHSKLSIDMKDRISIITFGEAIKKLIDFTFEEKKLIDSLNTAQISGKGILHDGIAFALQVLVEELRKIGGKTPRIVIFTDNKFHMNTNRLEKLMNIAKGLGVYIDICQLGGVQEHGQLSLKRIAQLTKGEYEHVTSSKEMSNVVKLFSSKKIERETFDYFSPESKEKMAPLISEIALPLRRPNVLEIRLMMDEEKKIQDKCHICHSVKAPATGADFFSEGRYCPSCDRAMHLSCCAMWAKKTEYQESIFRCPFCFFLLELPKAALKFAEEKIEEPKDIKILEEDQGKEVKMIQIPDKEIENIDASCSYCHNIFLGDYQVFQCNKCGSYYHSPCLEKMNNEIHACRYCGAKITSI
ncbi:MAG: vWA domain-containing protein [Promethearchaeota archaeon]